MMSDLEPKFIKAPFDAEYFQQLFSRPDTEIFPDEQELPSDDKELFNRNIAIQYRKKLLKLNRIITIQKGINETWFKLLETSLMGRVRQIEQSLIWEAKRKNDFNLEYSLSVEREGIVRFFESFMSISQSIAQLEEELRILKSKADRPDDLDIQAKLT